MAERLARGHGGDMVRLATGAEVAFAPRFSMRQGGGAESARVTLTGGAELDGDELATVLCRVQGAEAPWAARASTVDRLYAGSEAGAVLLAWLAALPCPIVNEPSSVGLAGPVLSQAHWLGLSARAGLPVSSLRFTPESRSPALLVEPHGSPRRVLVVGERVRGALPRRLHDAARALANRVRCRLLELTVVATSRGEVVTGVDPVPALLDPGDADATADLVDSLAAARAA